MGRADRRGAGRPRIDRLARWRPAWDIDVERRRTAAAAPRAGRARAADRDAVPDRRRGRDPRPARGARCAGPARLRPLRRPVRARDGPAPRQRRPLRAPTTPSATGCSTTTSRSSPASTTSRSPLPPMPGSRSRRLGRHGARGFLAQDGGALRPADGEAAGRSDGGVPPPVAAETTCRRTGSPRARFITYDSFQFMFEDGRITGLLDFEHAHVGDPMMDLAALRVRDTIKNIGELSRDRRRGTRRSPGSRSTTTSSSTTPSSTTRCR